MDHIGKSIDSKLFANSKVLQWNSSKSVTVWQMYFKIILKLKQVLIAMI